jgi:hypothetical protein
MCKTKVYINQGAHAHPLYPENVCRQIGDLLWKYLGKIPLDIFIFPSTCTLLHPFP